MATRVLWRRMTLAVFSVFLFVGSVSPALAATNLVPNPSLEDASADGITPLSWHSGNWGTNTAVFTYPTAGIVGAKSATVQLTARTDGDAKWYFDPVAVTPGTTYTFSDRYKSDVQSFITADFAATSGAHQYVDLVSPVASTAWTQTTAQFVVPQGVSTVTIYHLINKVGSLALDDASLLAQDATPPPPPTDPNNLIANPTLETASASGITPLGWLTGGWGTNTTTFAYPATGNNASRGAKVTVAAYTNGDAKWYGDLVNVTAGNTYKYSDYYTSTVSTFLTAEFRSSGGAVQYADLGTVPAATAWTQKEITFAVPAGMTSMRIFHLINQAGSLTIDDLSLTAQAVTPPPPPSDPSNLIPNSTLQASPTDPNTPTDWLRGGWGTNTSVLTYPATGYNGEKGLKVQTTSYSSGDSKWTFKPVPVTAGKAYEFHDYYQSTIASSLTVQYDMGNGNYSYVWLNALPATTAWTQSSGVFTPPTGAKTVAIFHAISGIGSLTTSTFLLKEQQSSPLPQAMVTLSFDDGFKTQYSVAKPILDKAGLKATFYITSGFLDDEFDDYMTTSEMLAMQTAGYEIGGHTKNHIDLTTLTTPQVQDEVSGGRADLIAKGVKTVSSFAYPFGAYNDQAIQVVKDSGFTNARSVNSGFNDKNSNPYLLMDQHLTSDVTVAQLKAWVDQAIAEKKWLIIEAHEQQLLSDDIYSNSAQTLQGLVDYLKQKNVKVVTATEGYNLIK